MTEQCKFCRAERVVELDDGTKFACGAKVYTFKVYTFNGQTTWLQSDRCKDNQIGQLTAERNELAANVERLRELLEMSKNRISKFDPLRRGILAELAKQQPDKESKGA